MLPNTKHHIQVSFLGFDPDFLSLETPYAPSVTRTPFLREKRSETIRGFRENIEPEVLMMFPS